MTPDHWLAVAELLLAVMVAAGVFKGVRWSWKKGRELNYYQMLATMHQKLADSASPERVKSLDLEFRDGSRFYIPLIMHERVPVGPGVAIMGIYADAAVTSYIVQVDSVWMLPEHRHAEAETVSIISGTMSKIKEGRNKEERSQEEGIAEQSEEIRKTQEKHRTLSPA